MDIFFSDPNDIPLPPEEVAIRNIVAEPYPDGHRIKIQIEITPFQQRPNLEVVLLNPLENPVASISIVEAIESRMDFTLHIRGKLIEGEYTLNARMFYSDISELQLKEDGEDDSPIKDIVPEKINVVDTFTLTFNL